MTKEDDLIFEEYSKRITAIFKKRDKDVQKKLPKVLASLKADHRGDEHSFYLSICEKYHEKEKHARLSRAQVQRVLDHEDDALEEVIWDCDEPYYPTGLAIEVFNIFDRNGNGLLDFREFFASIQKIEMIPWDKKEAKRKFKLMDLSGERQVSFEEFEREFDGLLAPHIIYHTVKKTRYYETMADRNNQKYTYLAKGTEVVIVETPPKAKDFVRIGKGGFVNKKNIEKKKRPKAPVPPCPDLPGPVHIEDVEEALPPPKLPLIDRPKINQLADGFLDPPSELNLPQFPDPVPFYPQPLKTHPPTIDDIPVDSHLFEMHDVALPLNIKAALDRTVLNLPSRFTDDFPDLTVMPIPPFPAELESLADPLSETPPIPGKGKEVKKKVFTNQVKDVDPASFSGGESKRASITQLEPSSKNSSVDPTSTQPSSGHDEDALRIFHQRVTSDDYSREPRSSSMQSPNYRNISPDPRISGPEFVTPQQNYGNMYDDAISDTFDTVFSKNPEVTNGGEYFGNTPQSLEDPYAYLSANKKKSIVPTYDADTRGLEQRLSNLGTRDVKGDLKSALQNAFGGHSEEPIYDTDTSGLEQRLSNLGTRDAKADLRSALQNAFSSHSEDNDFDAQFYAHDDDDVFPPVDNQYHADPFQSKANDAASVFTTDSIFTSRKSHHGAPDAFPDPETYDDNVFPPVNAPIDPVKSQHVVEVNQHIQSPYTDTARPAALPNSRHPYQAHSFPGPANHMGASRRRNSGGSVSTTAFAFGGHGHHQMHSAPPQPRVAAPIWFQHMPLEVRSQVLKELIFSLKRHGQLNQQVFNAMEFRFGLQVFQVKELYVYATKRKRKDNMASPEPAYPAGGFYNDVARSPTGLHEPTPAEALPEHDQMLVRLTELLRENGNNLTLRIFDAMKLDFGLNVAQVRQMYDRNFTQEVDAGFESATQPDWMFDFDYDTKRRMLLYYIQRYFEFGQLCPALYKEMADEYGLSQKQVRELHDYSKIKKSASDLRPAGATSPSWERYRTKRDLSSSNTSSIKPPRRKKPKVNESVEEVYVVGTDCPHLIRDFRWEPLSWSPLWEQGFIISKDIPVDDNGNIANISIVLKDDGKKKSSFNIMLSFNKLPSTFREARLFTTDLDGRSLLRQGDITRRVEDFGEVAINEDCSFILLQIPSTYPAFSTLQDNLQKGNVTFSIDLAFENHNPPSEVKYGAPQRLSAPVLRRLWGDRVYSDFTIICEGERIPCHRCVLAASSAKFLQYFEKNMKRSFEGEFEVSEAPPSIVLEFIKFMYIGDVSEEHIKPLLHLGYAFSAISLMEYCLKRLCANVAPHQRLNKLKSHVASLLLKDRNLNEAKSHPKGDSIKAKLYEMLELEEVGAAADLF